MQRQWLTRQINDKRKEKHIEKVAAIVEAQDYTVVPFGNLQHLQARILGRINGQRIAVDGYMNVPNHDDIEIQKALPGLEPEEGPDPELVIGDVVMQGTRKKVI